MQRHLVPAKQKVDHDSVGVHDGVDRRQRKQRC